MFQYFITVVPTRLNTYKISADTHQFSVTERVSKNWLKHNNFTPETWDTLLTAVLYCFQGEGDKPRGGQPRRFRHLREVWHQLADGDGQRAAHAAVAVPGAAVRHRRGYFLHDRYNLKKSVQNCSRTKNVHKKFLHILGQN